ncbi:hypothetical protein YB2330_004041 [Saitoella coloradoensis]
MPFFGSLRRSANSSCDSHSSSCSEDKSRRIDEQLRQLQREIPDADPEYLRWCLSFYDGKLEGDADVVERVREKIVVHNRGEYTKESNATTDVRKNALMDTLNELFPDTPVQALRDVISLAPAYTMAHVLVEELLRPTSSSMTTENGKKSTIIRRRGHIPPTARFRSENYLKACEAELRREFPDIHVTSIRAVIAECNGSWTLSRERLSVLNKTRSGMWRSLVNVFTRKRARSRSDSAAAGALTCPELEVELWEARKYEREALVVTDEQLARALNEQEYEKKGELVECGCCFGDYAWEDLASCSDGHLFCHECLKNTFKEGILGQGSLRGSPTVPCISLSGGDVCKALIPWDTIDRVVDPELRRMHAESVVREQLERSGVRVVRCSFCPYAEVEEVRWSVVAAWDGMQGSELLAALALLPILILGLAVVLLYATASVLVQCENPAVYVRDARRKVHAKCVDIGIQIRRKRNGSRFRCQNSDCSRDSCLECGREWFPFHRCFEEEGDGLRLYVEKAMADAVKRTCPICQVSFVKSDGCNKLVCPCGYAMCYVCRQDIREESYAHFCDHFRPVPGMPCQECQKCNLYVVEDEGIAVKEAAERARKEWLVQHRNFREEIYKGAVKGEIGPPGLLDNRSDGWDMDQILEDILGYFLVD